MFTSGATEANNLALAGLALADLAAGASAPRHLAVPATEHASVLAPARALAARGLRVTELPVDADGRCDAADVVGARPDLLSVALVNAETGVLHDVRTLGTSVRERGGFVHVDAAQAAAFLPLAVDTLGVDALTVSSTKLGGPAGAGALYVRRARRSHRSTAADRRSRAPGRHGASPRSSALRPRSHSRSPSGSRVARSGALRTRLAAGIARRGPKARFVLGAEVATVPHVLSLVCPVVVGEDVVAALDLEGVAASTGSACAAGAAEPSHVLLAMGRTAAEARGSLRVSLGWASTAADVDVILHALARVRARIARRSGEAAWPAHGS